MDDQLDSMLRRSGELNEAVLRLLDGADFDPSPRGQSAFLACAVSIEHAMSVKVLLSARCPTSVVGLIRMQFEAVTRGIWLLFAAKDRAISQLMGPLSTESEEGASDLPMLTGMIEQIGKRVRSGKAPAAAHQMLLGLKVASWNAMNSFVHNGIHPLRRQAEVYPLPLVLQLLRHSNALVAMAGMTLAILTSDSSKTKPMSQIQRDFADCLPDLLEQH